MKGLEVMPDHIHLFISVPPAQAVAFAVKLVKGTSARMLFIRFPQLKNDSGTVIYGILRTMSAQLGMSVVKPSGGTSNARKSRRKISNVQEVIRQMLLTLKAKIVADDMEQAVLLDAMLCATKVYNGLIWHLRDEFEDTGKSNVSKKNLNAIMKSLPRVKGYYSLSAQATRDEVIQAYHSFFALRKAGRTQHQMPGYRRKTEYSPLRYYDGYGFWINDDQ